MVGLADIPCMGKFVDRISEATVDAMFRGLRYMFCYKSLVTQLNSEIGKLNIEKDRMSRKAQEERDNGKIINDYVVTWQNDVEEIQKSAEEFSPSCSCSCIQSLPIPNPVSRFRIGRNAAKKAKTVTELAGSGKVYLTEEIAHLPPLKNIPKPATTFEEFQSRKDVYKKLWDALVNEDSPLIHGIHGMAGVGKTRMMEQFWEDAMKNDIFDKVVRVNVGSKNSDKIQLQDQIAGRLDCKLESQDVESRASQLENSLRNGGKILLILDDVWREIRLDDIIGTSFGDASSSKGSKILLTSREKLVLLLNKCKHLVEIKTLSPGEALYLFKNAVGPDTINSLQDESLVQKVCDECGNLPLLIHAVGKALEGEPHNSWKDAHDQLKMGKFEKIVGVDPLVYTCIKLSIDNLKDDDAKSCLFLCSLFPEDANIDMRMLIELATGSQLIPDGESRILAMVHYLKTSSLLLDSGNDNETKVHDIIRDVARSISFTESKYAFLQVTCNSNYLRSNATYCTRKLLRLDAETADVHFNENLVFPDLHTLWVQSNNHLQQFTGGFFSMFANLSFLLLERVNISLEQFSFQPLGNLGTLSLFWCDIRKTDVSLFPKNLKTLCIRYCHLPSPMDVGNLKYLRKLEIQEGPKLVMVSNVISSLSSLEELHIPNGFIIDGEGYLTEPTVVEISELTHLTSFHFHFYENNSFQGTNIFCNIDRYKIFVGAPEEFDYSELYWVVPSARSIALCGNHSESWECLMARAEEVLLSSNDVEVSRICNGHRRAFEDLKRLYIFNCDNMGHLASISQGEIQCSLQLATRFSKLTILDIVYCSNLKYVFCNDTAKSLVQLQKLRVERCDSMEAIIMNEGTSDGEVIIFPNLKSLNICDRARLASFYAEKKNVRSGSRLPADHSAQYQPFFDGMVAFPALENLVIQCLRVISVIWGKECYNDTFSSFCKLRHVSVSGCAKLDIVIPQAMLHRLNNLEYIRVDNCSSLRSMFPSCVASDLTHLKELRVDNCGEMREITEAGEQVITTDAVAFPQLTLLNISRMPCLTSFWCYPIRKDHDTTKVPLRLPQLSSVDLKDLPDLKNFFHGANFEFHMPALKEVKIDTCGLSTLFTFSVFRKFQLEKLRVSRCELLENIVEDLRGDEICDKIITLSQLTAVTFEDLPKLKTFFHNANYVFHMPVLTGVLIRTCGFSDTLFKHSVLRNLNQLEKLEVSDCRLLEAIFEDVRADETLDTNGILFPMLKYLKLVTLPCLTSFWCYQNGKDNTCKVPFRLPQLSSIVLEYLPDLQSFFQGANFEFHMPDLKMVNIDSCRLSTLFTFSMSKTLGQLKDLIVCNCEMLEAIFEDPRTDETLDTSDKIITLNRVSVVYLRGLPKLKSIFYGATYESYMPALKTVSIVGCGLSVLFTCSVFRGIQQLEKLHVSDCKSLEHIVEEVGSDQISEINGTSITSSQLSSITLESLPNLKSFSCSSNYVFNMSKLQNFRLIECPQIICFSSLKTNTSLVCVTREWGRKDDIQDLNDYISQNLGTQSERIEEEKPQEIETDQPDTSVWSALGLLKNKLKTGLGRTFVNFS